MQEHLDNVRNECQPEEDRQEVRGTDIGTKIPVGIDVLIGVDGDGAATHDSDLEVLAS